jgi:hypothetical protein
MVSEQDLFPIKCFKTQKQIYINSVMILKILEESELIQKLFEYILILNG